MHHALEIQEILSDIFSYCSPSGLNTYHCKKATSDLAALARTCHAFKEPALDVLWRSLKDLSPLARCLPEISQRISPGNMYSFSRPMTHVEWNILRSYTRRVQFILDFNRGLDWESVATFFPTTAPLFPKLRTLRYRYTGKTMPLLHLPLPSLVNLFVRFENLHLFQDPPMSFPEFSPNIRTLSLNVGQSNVVFNKFISNYMCRWQDLHTVTCPEIALEPDALVHLSRMPPLIRLHCALSGTLPESDSLFIFSNLQALTLHCKSLKPISQFLSQARLPSIRQFCAFIESCPDRQDLTSFLANVPTSNTGHTIQTLRLQQLHDDFGNVLRSDAVPLGVEDLQSWMTFSNLRDMELNIEYNIDLTDNDVLLLALAWPKLEHFSINVDWGWNTTSGVTPGGVVRLLQTCRSLTRMAFRLDTRGYTKVPPSQVPASLGLMFPTLFSIDVLDSSIEPDSVPAIATFLSGIAARSRPRFFICAWNGTPIIDFPNREAYKGRWSDVVDRVTDSLRRRSDSGDSGGVLNSNEK